MKIVRVVYVPKVSIEFTRSEVEALRLLSKHHYDHKCQQLSIPGPGAVINGMINRLDYDPEMKGKSTVESMPLTSDEVQLLTKCCEQADVMASTFPEVKENLHLWFQLHQVIKRLNDEYRDANQIEDQKV